MHQIEPLEARIAPATLLPGNKVLTYKDVDGDLVTLKASLPVLQSFHFVFDTAFDSEGPQQLRLIDFMEGTVGTFSVTMTVKRGPQGDGLANVGALVTDDDMESITIKGDLGRLMVGDSDSERQGLKSLSVNSLGALGTSTQIGGSIVSAVKGGMGTLKVRTDLFGVLNVLDATDAGSGKLGSATIGGSIVGDDVVLGGVISTGGDIGSITVKGSVRGGGVQGSGQINAGGSIGNVVIGGSLLGNSGGNGAGGLTDAPFGSGSIIAGRVLSLIGSIKSVTIGGDMHGDSGTGSGSIISSLAEGEIGTVTVKGSIVGGSGNHSGTIYSNSRLGKLTVGGSIIGTSGNYSLNEDMVGQVLVSGTIGPVKITGDLIGGVGNGSGRISSGETITSVTVGGSVIAGGGFKAGSIHSVGDLGKISVKRNLDGRDTAFFGIGMIEGSDIAGLTVGGFLESGIIHAHQQMGAVSIGGTMKGSRILGTGQQDAVEVDLAIKSVKVKGSVISSQILAGFNPVAPGMSDNADAQIGSITVGGDWIASSVAAGVNSTDAYFGDGNDVIVGASNDPEIISRIASIAITGQVIGSTGGVDHFGFIAQQIGKIKVGGFPVKLEADAGDDLIELSLVTDDVTIRELPTL